MKEKLVAFISISLKEDYLSLKYKRFEDKELYESISKAINDLKKDTLSGIKVQRKLWPKEYTKDYAITNLWKINLIGAWRLIYTIESDEVRIVSIILDVFNHKDYEKKFKY